jgi:hypothetical protein
MVRKHAVAQIRQMHAIASKVFRIDRIVQPRFDR